MATSSSTGGGASLVVTATAGSEGTGNCQKKRGGGAGGGRRKGGGGWREGGKEKGEKGRIKRGREGERERRKKGEKEGEKTAFKCYLASTDFSHFLSILFAMVGILVRNNSIQNLVSAKNKLVCQKPVNQTATEPTVNTITIHFSTNKIMRIPLETRYPERLISLFTR